MQIDGMKLVFVMNCSVIHFFKSPSRMPQIALILVTTFKIFRGDHGLGPQTLIEISSLFFITNSRL